MRRRRSSSASCGKPTVNDRTEAASAARVRSSVVMFTPPAAAQCDRNGRAAVEDSTRLSLGSDRGLWGRPATRSTPSGVRGSALEAERPEAVAKLGGEELRLLPGGEVPALLGLVEVREVRVDLLGP